MIKKNITRVFHPSNLKITDTQVEKMTVIFFKNYYFFKNEGVDNTDKLKTLTLTQAKRYLAMLNKNVSL